MDSVVGRSALSAYFTRVLHQAVRFHRAPSGIRTHQEPAFAGKAMYQWAYAHTMQLKLIQPGELMNSVVIENFNSRFRDECLNDRWFANLAHARAEVAGWRRGLQRGVTAFGAGLPAPA